MAVKREEPLPRPRYAPRLGNGLELRVVREAEHLVRG